MILRIQGKVQAEMKEVIKCLTVPRKAAFCDLQKSYKIIYTLYNAFPSTVTGERKKDIENAAPLLSVRFKQALPITFKLYLKLFFAD